MFQRIAVIGAGGWGTALSLLLCERAGRVALWAHRGSVADEIRQQRTNATFLPGVMIPPGVEVSNDLAEVVKGADLIVLVTPSRAVREVSSNLARCGAREDAVIVSCTKGIEHESGLLMDQVISEQLPGRRVAVLSGPNLAHEVARGIPATGVIGSADAAVLPRLQEAFSTATFRAYTSDDVAGIQLGGALKNIFAIAAGACDGFGMGDNTKAGLVTRALAEMMRLGVAMGGRRETFYGLSGVGDLMVTCFSRHSRNRTFGERLGRGETPDGILASMQMVAEGVPTVRSALQCARKLRVDVPLTEQVHAVVHEAKDPRAAIGELLGRPPRAESDDAKR